MLGISDAISRDEGQVAVADKYSTHDDPLRPMSRFMRTFASCWFELPDLEKGDWDIPVGLLVGEQPGSNSNPKMALWPFPPNSAGGRLFKMSGMDLTDYFRLLARVNIAKRPVARWNANGARARGLYILSSLSNGTRVVACGARARDALGVGDFFRLQWITREDGSEIQCVAVPHPSGRNGDYRDPDNVKLAGSWIRWAARMR